LPEEFGICAEVGVVAAVAAEFEEAAFVGCETGAEVREVASFDVGGGVANFVVDALTFEMPSICMIPPHVFQVSLFGSTIGKYCLSVQPLPL
jgi:hypothetical protein